MLSAALAFGSAGLAQADDLDDKIDEAEALGEAIYKQDIAAWVATDEMFEYVAENPDFDTGRLGGWISYEDGRRYKTVFFSKDKNAPRALFEVESKKRVIKKSGAVDRALTAEETRLWRARTITLPEDLEVCTQFTPYNMAVVEKPDGNGYYTYLLAATKEPNLIVLGRHYRFDVDDNGTIRDQFAFTNSCFALSLNVGENGEHPLAMMASHLKADYPQEHHVFANLMWDMDLYVSTGQESETQLWKVSDGKIKAAD